MQKEFENRLKEIRGRVNDHDSNSSKSEKEPYIIPEEFKAHYSGKFGECDYDTRMFEKCEEYVAYLHYREDSSIPPVMPDGYESCYSMFSDYDSLTTLDLSNFDTSQVEGMDSMFYDCVSLTEECKSKLRAQGFNVQ